MASIELYESEVRYAALNSKNNTEAANFLHIGLMTWKRYASRYINPNTGVSYYESLHPKFKRKEKQRKHPGTTLRTNIYDIMDGKYPKYSLIRFERRLIDEKIKQECCEMCGFSERNIATNKVPIKLIFLDNDTNNKHIDNLQFYCYNCIALTTNYKIIIK